MATTKPTRKPKGYKKMNGGAWIRREKRFAIYLRDGFRCGYCKTDLRTANRFDINLDHIICRGEKGSTNEPTNLITSCRSCNSKRQDKKFEYFATKGQQKRIIAQTMISLDIELAKAILTGRTGVYDN